MNIIEQYYEEEFLKADGFDDAIIGVEGNETVTNIHGLKMLKNS